MSVRCDMCERKMCNGEDCVHSEHADVCFKCVDMMHEQLTKLREAKAAAEKKVEEEVAAKAAATEADKSTARIEAPLKGELREEDDQPEGETHED